MSIKSPPPQLVRLRPRSDPAAAGAARQRALRQQYNHRYGAEAAPPDEADGVTHTEQGPVDGDGVAGLEPPPPATSERPAASAPPPAASDGGSGLADRIARACARDERNTLRNARLAAIIAQFCNGPGILESGGWHLQIAIDPVLLPATRLHLTLSSCRLSLRFETGDPEARRVILDNSKELRHRLGALLPAQIEVDIVCW